MFLQQEINVIYKKYPCKNEIYCSNDNGIFNKQIKTLKLLV